MSDHTLGDPPKGRPVKMNATCKPKHWPSSEQRTNELKKLLTKAEKTANTFHKQAQVEPDSLHDPVTL